MGTDKALLKIGDKTIIERTCDLMSNIFENILLSTNDFESYRFLGLPMVADLYKDQGPISGVHAALVASKTDRNFILSCDQPLMHEEMIRYIIEFNSSKPISIPVAKGKTQHLCGVYHKSLIPVIEKMISESDRLKKGNGKSSASVKQLIQKAGAEIVETKALSFLYEDVFFNMNSEDDFYFIKNKILE